MFYGIIVYMLFKDNKEHHLPHIHVKYAEHKAVFDIASGNVLSGSLPPKETRLVQAWIDLHSDELKANWSLAIEGEPLYPIDPLR
jgi:hypothetical protein